MQISSSAPTPHHREQRRAKEGESRRKVLKGSQTAGGKVHSLVLNFWLAVVFQGRRTKIAVI